MGDEAIAEQSAPPAVVARGISVTGPWGAVFGPLDFEIGVGGVTALRCRPGPERTALLMTLAGRMRLSSGLVTVFGQHEARDIFDVSALAGIEQLDLVAESVTVQDLITEQSRWNAPWHRVVRRAGGDELESMCRPVFGDLSLPPLTEYVERLDEVDALLLRIALANTARPPLLVVGGIDQIASDDSRELLVARLVDLGQHQTVITATVNDIPASWQIAEQPLTKRREHAVPTATDQEGDN